MPRAPQNPGAWPRYMRAETAAAYCDEVSVEAFLRKVGKVYPKPLPKTKGSKRKWDRLELDKAGAGPSGPTTVFDAASVL